MQIRFGELWTYLGCRITQWLFVWIVFCTLTNILWYWFAPTWMNGPGSFIPFAVLVGILCGWTIIRIHKQNIFGVEGVVERFQAEFPRLTFAIEILCFIGVLWLSGTWKLS